VQTSAKFRENFNLYQFKVIDFGTNRKRIYDLLSVINEIGVVDDGNFWRFECILLRKRQR